MKRHVIVAVSTAALLSACTPLTPSPSPTPAPTPSLTPSPTQSVYATSTPDVGAPPYTGTTTHRPRPENAGALNPSVTQDTIRTTICTPGYTATIRPPASYTTPLKRQQIKTYKYVDTRMSSYEEDHLVPLELGGAPADVKNLWPEPIAEARVKDRDENSFHADVCAGRTTLAAAQQAMLQKWGVK